MAYISNFFKRIFNFRKPNPTTNVEQRVSRLLRPYAGTLQDVLLWKNPLISISFIVTINLLYWLLRIMEIRPLGLIGICLLLIVLLDGLATVLGVGKRPCRERIPSRNGSGEQLMRATVRAQQWLSVAYADMINLRQENPSKFCVIVCSSMGALWFMNSIGGAIFSHALITLALLSPLAPNLHSTINAMHCNTDSDHDVEEFMPDFSQKEMEELNRAGEIQEKKECNSLIMADLSLSSDVNAALSYAAGELESSDEDDEENFLETSKQEKSQASTPSLPPTDSSDSDNDFIPDGNEKRSSIQDKNVAVVEKIINTKDQHPGSWIPSIFRYPWATTPAVKSDSDSDEFELIDKNDL